MGRCNWKYHYYGGMTGEVANLAYLFNRNHAIWVLWLSFSATLLLASAVVGACAKIR